MAKLLRRILRALFGGLILVVAAIAALFLYFLYTPAPDAPQLSGAWTRGTIDVGGLTRTYLAYAPKDLPAGSSLVIALHGSDGNGERLRKETGYAFERLADERRFAVAYPDAYEGNWNACNIVGDYGANRLDVDDVGFIAALVDKLASESGFDRRRVFAMGVSRGGQMAFRLAIEAPSRLRALAAVGANVPAKDNFKCAPAGGDATSVMIMNGVVDPLNPFNGGETGIFGLYKRGVVRSSVESAEYFADLLGIAERPRNFIRPEGAPDGVEEIRWRNPAGREVDLVAFRNGGHVLPQPYCRAPRLLGPTPQGVDGPAMIWDFFSRQ